MSSIDILKNSKLLTGVSEELSSVLLSKAKARSVKGKNVKIDSDELSFRLFMIVSGTVRVLRISADGQECLMQTLQPGEFFCLASVWSGRHCGSQLVCQGKTELLSWDHKFIRQACNQDPLLNQNLMQQIACQVEDERDMRALTRCCKADVRVAAFLLHKLNGKACCHHCHCNESSSIDLKPITLAAQELGLARETLSRSLNNLVKRQAIEYDKGLVTVTSLSLLESVIDEADCNCQS